MFELLMMCNAARDEAVSAGKCRHSAQHAVPSLASVMPIPARDLTSEHLLGRSLSSASAFGFACFFFCYLSKRVGILPVKIKEKFKPL